MTTAQRASERAFAAVRAGVRSGKRLGLVAGFVTLLSVGLCAVAQDEVPFITTPDAVTRAMLTLAAVSADDYVIDLGSGDGRIVITAARLHGARGLGVEIVPDLVARSLDNARRAGVAERVDFKVQDLFATPLDRATVITMYLLPEVNMQLRPRLLRLKPGTRIVSHDWDLGDWPADKAMSLDVPDKAIGREKRSHLRLWVVPADVHGVWCTAGAMLTVAQRFQSVSAELAWRPRTSRGVVPDLVFDARFDAGDGLTLRATGAAAAQRDIVFDAADGRLRLNGELVGAAKLPAGSVFERSRGGPCPP